MPEALIQFSFNSGEWAPALNARTDLAKYRNGAALLRNFFIDYRGGATTRPGTRFLLPTYLTTTARLIPFQASTSISYILEFGDGYIRPFSNGAPVLEATFPVTSIGANSPPGMSTTGSPPYSDGDWVYIDGTTGMTPSPNGQYYLVDATGANTFNLYATDGSTLDFTGFGTATGGTVQRVFTLLTSPYAASEVGTLKFTQNVSTLILCHPNHVPYELVLGDTPTSWTISAITFGSTASAPSAGLSLTSTFAGGTINYAYVVTSIDENGQESGPSAFITGAFVSDLRTVAGTNTVAWTAVTGATQYNIYKAQLRYGSAVPAGSMFGYIGFATSTTFVDSNIGPDFSQTPPVSTDPFSGSGVQSVTVTNKGTVTIFPSVSFTASPGVTTQALCTVEALAITNIVSGGTGFAVGNSLPMGAHGVVGIVTSVGGAFGDVTGASLVNRGSYAGSAGDGLSVGNYVVGSPTSMGAPASFQLSWRLNTVDITVPGTGYAGAPTVTFTNGGGSTATATLGAPSAGNPTVPAFYDQRLVLAGPVASPQQFNMSQPGAQYNFDVSSISQADDAIQGTLVSGQLSTIQSLIAQPQGLVVFSDNLAWLINGGSPGAAISPFAIAANPQAYNGANFLPPIVANDHMLYVQSKGSIVRDSIFNWSKQVYSGTDISTISSHLFYGYTLHEWAWAEEPYKVVWAVRSDGALLCLTFLPEQELIAWTHSDTSGAFQSVATVTETIGSGVSVDAIYFIVQREINGSTVQYVERLADIPSPQILANSWQVDAGITYSGAAALTFTGAQHLAGETVTGVATTDATDAGVTAKITPFVMDADGTFTLPTPAAPATGYTSVTLGLAFTCQLKTVALDAGDPTVQAALKKVSNVTVRVREALGLQIGVDFDHLVPMKDLIVGNVSSMLTGLGSQRVTDLVTGDAREFINPTFNIPGQFCIQIDEPYPASILGLITDVTMGDTATTKRR